MKHAILGFGNLGIDLAQALSVRDYDVTVYRNGEEGEWLGVNCKQFDYPKDAANFFSDDPLVIWCCIGAGSVEQGKADFPTMMDAHVRLPADILNEFPNAYKVFFSTDYLQWSNDPYNPKMTGEPHSLYAYSKKWLEELVRKDQTSRRSVAIRIGSLYGNHHVERTFPGKLRRNHPKAGDVTLPDMWITPTPTWWIAEKLADHWTSLFDFNLHRPVHHLAPSGNCHITSWGKLVLGDDYTIKIGDTPNDRPILSNLGCSIPGVSRETFLQLWDDERNALHLERYEAHANRPQQATGLPS